jgi:hypothetical protein
MLLFNCNRLRPWLEPLLRKATTTSKTVATYVDCIVKIVEIVYHHDFYCRGWQRKQLRCKKYLANLVILQHSQNTPTMSIQIALLIIIDVERLWEIAQLR